MAHFLTRREALVLLPLPGRMPKAHANRDAPYRPTEPDFGIDTREGFHGTAPGAFWMRRSAAPAPLPASRHPRWVSDYVV